MSWITLECIFSPRFVHKLFLFFAPGKKKDFFVFGKDYLDQNEASPFFVLFVLFEVIVQLCWHASLVQELILLSIRLLEQSTCICFYKKRACIWRKKFYLFFDKEGAIAFFSYQRLLGAYSAVIQKVSREQLLQVCGSYFDDTRQVIGKPPDWSELSSRYVKRKKDCKRF